jgi:hypothetical protein
MITLAAGHSMFDLCDSARRNPAAGDALPQCGLIEETKKERAVRDVEIVLALTGFSCGLMSAWFWYRASMDVAIPTWVNPGSPEATRWIVGLLVASNEVARLNKIAALWTAASVAIGVVENLLGSWPA